MRPAALALVLVAMVLLTLPFASARVAFPSEGAAGLVAQSPPGQPASGTDEHGTPEPEPGAHEHGIPEPGAHEHGTPEPGAHEHGTPEPGAEADDHLPIQRYYHEAFFNAPWRTPDAWRPVAGQAAAIFVLNGLLLAWLWRFRWCR